ncbi:ADP-heptose:LPS heptosyl transferase, putative [Babesia ovata]|uniref:ADP-heptose:LPS heptosyl transferase, putative n=1 Tax=Babesia ovata TaxID=189622 RepID=A0A2H6KB65_9APIC|nr:ADP-heptose:LPS heptosyl transferase, putative [Babesia ovata]GBE60226.1 ADP-heptose:LPS heptosyl transferase, putative [Babesia ovata]
MSTRATANILSMDVVQLSHYVRKRFQPSLVATEDTDENRDLAFQILALKDQLQNNRKERIKIFYNLVQAAHYGFFSHKATRNVYIGFPYLHRHFSENYRTFAAGKPDTNAGLGDQLLFDAGKLLSQNTFSAAAAHLRAFSNDHIGAFLNEARRHDEYVRVSKLYVKTLVELLGKSALTDEIKTEIKNAIAQAAKQWSIEHTGEENIDNLIGWIPFCSVLGLEDPGLMPVIENVIRGKRLPISNKGKLMLLFGMASHVDAWGAVSWPNVIDRLLMTFQDTYRSLDLKDSLLFVQCLANMRYRQRLLDQVVGDNIIPRISKIRMEDMMQLLQCFVKLDFRCSRVISEFESAPIFMSLTAVDRAVLVR